MWICLTFQSYQGNGLKLELLHQLGIVQGKSGLQTESLRHSYDFDATQNRFALPWFEFDFQ